VAILVLPLKHGERLPVTVHGALNIAECVVASGFCAQGASQHLTADSFLPSEI